MNTRHSLLMIMLTALFAGLFAAPVFAGDAAEVAFSGVVKKVTVGKQKVAIQEPETKKRFTVTLDKDTRLTGYAGIADIKKGDNITGAYAVTPAGVYLAKRLAAAE